MEIKDLSKDALVELLDYARTSLDFLTTANLSSDGLRTLARGRKVELEVRIKELLNELN